MFRNDYLLQRYLFTRSIGYLSPKVKDELVRDNLLCLEIAADNFSIDKVDDICAYAEMILHLNPSLKLVVGKYLKKVMVSFESDENIRTRLARYQPVVAHITENDFLEYVLYFQRQIHDHQDQNNQFLEALLSIATKGCDDQSVFELLYWIHAGYDEANQCIVIHDRSNEEAEKSVSNIDPISAENALQNDVFYLLGKYALSLLDKMQCVRRINYCFYSDSDYVISSRNSIDEPYRFALLSAIEKLGEGKFGYDQSDDMDMLARLAACRDTVVAKAAKNTYNKFCLNTEQQVFEPNKRFKIATMASKK